MIHVTNLTKSFGSFKALKGIDINVDKNDIYGFLGHNGAGKSTTINILAGLSKMDGGKCTINGIELTNKLNKHNYCLGYLPEEPSFYRWMTAKEYLSYIGSDYGKNVKKRVSEMLAWVGLEKAANRKIKGFSRGMRQRLGMAVALFYNPDLLLLDEPSSALDPQGRADILSMIKNLRDDGKTIFLSTHILDDVERVCSKVGILSSGEMIEEMKLTKLIDKYVSSIYEMTFADIPSNKDVLKVRNIQGATASFNENILLLRLDKKTNNNSKIYSLVASFETAVKSVSLKKHSLEQIFIDMTNKEGKDVARN